MFKEIRNQIKDIEIGASELNKSFEGEFFASSPWFLSNLDFEGFSELEAPTINNLCALEEKAEEEFIKPLEAKQEPIEPKIEPQVSQEEKTEKVEKKVETKIEDDSNSPNFTAAYEALGPGFAPKKRTNGGKLEATSERISEISKFISEVNKKEVELSNITGMSELNLDTGIKVLFVGERNIENINDEEAAHFHSDSNRVDLLGKMIGAMKLSAGEFVRSALVEYDGSDEESVQRNLNNICNEISLLKPKVVISLGAVSANLLLGKKERLSQVHGEFFTRQYSFTSGEELDFKMIPIFHPDFLEINPSMKRTAWLDLQKVMELLEIPLK